METSTLEAQGAIDMEIHRTGEAIKSICDIEGIQLNQMITYIIDQRLIAEKRGRESLEEKPICEKNCKFVSDKQGGSYCTECGQTCPF